MFPVLFLEFNSLWPNDSIWRHRFGKHWLREWLATWRQAITRTNVDLSSMEFCGIPLTPVLQKLRNSPRYQFIKRKKITLLRLKPQLLGDNELSCKWDASPSRLSLYDVTIQGYRKSHAKIKVIKMHILSCMVQIFFVKFQRRPLKFHTNFGTHTPQNMQFLLKVWWITLSDSYDLKS